MWFIPSSEKDSKMDRHVPGASLKLSLSILISCLSVNMEPKSKTEVKKKTEGRHVMIN